MDGVNSKNLCLLRVMENVFSVQKHFKASHSDEGLTLDCHFCFTSCMCKNFKLHIVI